jgi:hypothetical protein
MITPVNLRVWSNIAVLPVVLINGFRPSVSAALLTHTLKSGIAHGNSPWKNNSTTRVNGEK